MLPPTLSREHGFTLVELLIAIAILAIGLTVILSNFLSSNALNTNVVRTNDAVRVSEALMDSYRQRPTFIGMTGTNTQTLIRNSVPYTVVTTFCPADKPETMPCSSTAVYIRIAVSFNDKQLQKIETYYTKLDSGTGS